MLLLYVFIFYHIALLIHGIYGFKLKYYSFYIPKIIITKTIY